MAFPNISDILATTIESRTRKIADNVTKNNVILMKLEGKGKIKPFSGGHKILQELSFAENSNAGWYSGYDILPVGVSDVISAAEFNIKQAAVPVIISGLEMLQNAGREKMIDLMD
ncbi:MAG: phage major capsid protein, partial [Gammaproteobacteria bacterium]